MSRRATPEKVEELDTTYLECRDYLHAWRLQSLERNSSDILERTLRCTRCKTVRTDLLYTSGEIYSRSYKHPENYLLKGVATDPDRKAHCRAELMKRLLGH